MAFCGQCGAQISEGQRFCPSCGAPVAQANAQQGASQTTFQSQVENTFNQFTNTADTTGSYDQNDINQNKGISVFAYLSWLLLIPMFAAKDSEFARFHTNQGLVLAIFETAWWIISPILSLLFFWSFIGVIITIISWLLNLAFLALAIIGIVNVVQGKAKELPVIGNIRILK